MSIVYILIVVGIVFVVAAAAIGREARRLDAVPPQPVFDLDEGVDFVADRLPDDMTSRLSYDDVEQLISWDLEYIRSKGVAGNGTAPRITEKVVVGGTEVIDYVLQRADAAGMDVTPAEVHSVLTHTLEYLAAIHAVGPEAPAADREPTLERPLRRPGRTISGQPKPQLATGPTAEEERTPQTGHVTDGDGDSGDGSTGDGSRGEGNRGGRPPGGDPPLPGSLN